MTPIEFTKKRKLATLRERQGSQEHFIDLCRLLGQPTPSEVDPHGDWFCFERGAKKACGGDGWADIWRRGCFGWEYKGKQKDLDAAFAQFQRYAIALEKDCKRYDSMRDWEEGLKIWVDADALQRNAAGVFFIEPE